VKEKSTKRANTSAKSGSSRDDELRPEYDDTVLKNGVRGKYAKRFAAGTNLVRLDGDVAAVFPTDKAVNEALRLVIRVASDARRLVKR
jgi:hypothetical protein